MQKRPNQSTCRYSAQGQFACARDVGASSSAPGYHHREGFLSAASAAADPASIDYAAAVAWQGPADKRSADIRDFEMQAEATIKERVATQAAQMRLLAGMMGKADLAAQKHISSRADGSWTANASVETARLVPSPSLGAPIPVTTSYKPRHATNKCVTGGATGSHVNILACNESDDQQKWRFDANGRFVNTKTGLCANIDHTGSAAPDPLTPLVMRACETATKWNSDGQGMIRSATWKDVCMDVLGNDSSSGARLIAYPCHGQLNQQFVATGP